MSVSSTESPPGSWIAVAQRDHVGDRVPSGQRGATYAVILAQRHTQGCQADPDLGRCDIFPSDLVDDRSAVQRELAWRVDA
jgi:hypothetical protein